MTATTARTVTTARRSPARIALYTLQVVLGLFLAVGSGLPKLFGEATAVQIFDQIGAGQWLRYLVGICEVAGGIGLLVPVVAGLAAACFVALMVGATVVQLTVVHAYWYTPVIIGVLMAVVAWARRAEIVALLRR
ncbi:DoxX family protein [Pseudonocardia oroxyli]|uniref:DoxX-like family protein n=1 Tax=Pseudonocardia oroxyli TaxID=366584 RepID=A0A1G7KN65_PSEOR|nr:DoxX family protein [Pseudonocardia oroxyli]SDF38571.1 DoxX-like family protein [Pseudonocardia oroxyli]